MWIKTQFDDIQFQIRELVVAQTLPWQNSQRRDNQELIPDLCHMREGFLCLPFPFLNCLAVIVSGPLYRLQGCWDLSVGVHPEFLCGFTFSLLSVLGAWSAKESFQSP